jgi:hypothetical protein
MPFPGSDGLMLAVGVRNLSYVPDAADNEIFARLVAETVPNVG